MSYDRAMLNRQDLAALLMTVNVKALADASGVSEKTIYRLRRQEFSPTYSTVEKLMKGTAALAPKKSRAKVS